MAAEATLGEAVRSRRRQAGWTLAALADEAAVTKGYLSMIENDRLANPPSREVLEALEQALGLTGQPLLRLAGWQRANPELREEVAHLAENARRGRELAQWLAANTSRRAGGGKNLDRLFRSGRLRKRINQALGQNQQPNLADAPAMRLSVPLINKVAAGYPHDFTDLDYPARVADEYIPCPQLNDPDAFAATVVGRSMEPDYREGEIIVFSPAAEVTAGCDAFVRLEPDHETTFKRIYFDDDGQTIRLQPCNPAFAPQLYPREQVAGLYRAVWRLAPL